MQTRFILIFVAAAAALLAGCSNGSSGPQDVPKVVSAEAQSCATFIDSLPAGYEHGYIDSPEEPGNPQSPMLKIFYAYRAPLKGRIVLFLNGGPGGSVHSSRKLMDEATVKMKREDQLTFVYMDQRGNGCSSPYPDEDTDAKIYARAKWYGTRGIVADAEVLRAKLVGTAPWTILGQSYGAMIAHRYAVLYPQSLERVVAYANTLSANNFSRFTDRVISQVDVWEAYFLVYPGDRVKMETLLTNLKPELCLKVKEFSTCGYELIEPLTASFLGFNDEWPLLHRWLGKLAPASEIDQKQLQIFADYFPETGSRPRWRSLSAVNYYDRDVVSINQWTCLRASLAWSGFSARTPFAAWLTECSAAIQLRYSSNSYDRASAFFGMQHDTMIFEDLKRALKGKPKSYFLLYSGTLDPYVPERSFKEEVTALGELITYTNFPDAGHEGFYTKAKVFDDLLAD